MKLLSVCRTYACLSFALPGYETCRHCRRKFAIDSTGSKFTDDSTIYLPSGTWRLGDGRTVQGPGLVRIPDQAQEMKRIHAPRPALSKSS